MFALRVKRSKVVSMMVLSGLIALLAVAGLPQTAQSAGGLQSEFQAAWQRANAATSYRFTAQLKQTLNPRASADLIGQQSQYVTLDMDGEVQQPDRSRTNLRLSSQLGSPASVTLIRAGNRSFIQQGDQLQPATDSSNLAVPTSPDSFIDYATAATHVREIPDAANPRLTHYVFELDPGLLVHQLLARIAPGDSVQPVLPAAYRQLTGQGEVWLNAAGLPQRQIIRLNLPQATPEYDAQVELSLNLSDWNQAAPVPVPVQNNQGLWQLQAGTPATGGNSAAPMLPLSPEAQQAMIILSGFSVIALAFSLWYSRHRKAATLFVTVLVCFALISATPLQVLAQSIGRAAPEVSIASALGLTRSPATTQPRVNQLVQKYNRALQGPTTTLAKCGDGVPGVDTDKDGLTDQQELCLGTSPYVVDTDTDEASDFQEVTGFDCGGKHWTTDPLNADSNRDSLTDGQQWPDPANISGTCDPKGQGSPNVWNMDNDGDGVANSIDLSPQAATPYSPTFNLQMYYAGSITDTLYVELEVRPSDINHLRYSTTGLDWPDGDNQGQIQDLDTTQEDLHLIPMLEIQTNISNTTWASQYSYIARPSGAGATLYVPLAPIGEGGLNQTFYGKVAYAPGELAKDQQIYWGMQLVWLVQVQNDQYQQGSCDASVAIGGPTVYSNCRTIETAPQVVNIYRAEDFSVTGLKITRSRGFEGLVFGTPQYPTEDNYLFQTALSLSDLFLNYTQVQSQTHAATALQEIAYRFTHATPSGLRFNLPNTLTVAMSTTQTSHLDEGLSALNQTLIPQFLNTYYAAPGQPCTDSTGASFVCTTLGIASEFRLAAHDLGDLQYAPAGNLYRSSLTDMSFVALRNVKAILYERLTSGEWRASTLSREFEIIGRRYAGQMDAILQRIQQTRPQATKTDVQAGGFLPYTLLWSGLEAVAEIDTQKVLDPTAVDEERFLASEFTDVFSLEIMESGFSLFEIYSPGYDLVGLPPNKLGAKIQWVSNRFTNNNARLSKVLGGVTIGVQVALLAAEITNIVCEHYENDDCQAALEVIEPILRTGSVLVTVAAVVKAFGELDFLEKGLGYLNKVKTSVKGTSGIIAVVGTAVSIGFTWTTFGLLAASNQGGYGYEPTWRAALAVAIVNTIWALAVLAISFVPVFGQILATIINLIDLIFVVATGGKYNLATSIAEFFYGTTIDTGLNLDATKFQTVRSVFISPNRVHLAGPIAGNIFHLDQWFIGVITATATGTNSDLDASAVLGYFQDVKSVPGGDGNSSNTSSSCVPFYFDANQAASARECRNQLSAEFPLAAGVNAQIQFVNLIDFTYRWRETAVWGAATYTHQSSTTTLPDKDNRTPTTLHIDVLPATLDGLWNWSALSNPDSDGDGLLDSQEQTLGTDRTKPDTDGDGLSDAFEVNKSKTKPLVADTDRDSLPDGFEVRLGSDPNTADSDGDGLNDSAELFHFDGVNWVGGWNVTLPGNKIVRVYSDPFNADADGDGLLDNVERSNQLSPTAYHVSSHFALSVQPLTNNPGGAWLGAAIAPNGLVTFTTSLGANILPITSTLSQCLPSFLTNLQTNTAGDHTPATQSTACTGGTGLTWNFGGANALQPGQVFTATVTARANPALTSSLSGTVTATITTAALVLSDTARIVVDADTPQVTITAPANTAILKRAQGGTTYIIGGVASDATSWISDTQVNVGAGFVAATGSKVWSYAWTLPADGTYVVQARAHDHVGYTSPVTSVNVIVDGTSPTGTLAATAGTYFRPSVSGTVQLSGTVSDNLVGVSFVQISFNNQPWQTVLSIPATSQVLNTNWAYTWTLPTADSSGTYRVDVRVIDRANNESTRITKQIVVDALPPSSDLTTQYYLGSPYVRAGQAITLVGRANDLGYAPLIARPAALTGTLNSLSHATTWLQYSKISDDDAGVRLTWLGDINGDARADLAIGLPNSDNGAGRVALINGRGGNWPTPPASEAIFNSPTSFVGAAGAGLGAQVASAGDVNGDGFFDTLIGDPANQRVFLVFGNGQALGNSLALTGTTESALWTVLNVAGLGVLHQVSSAGDVNGDGYADMFIVMDKGGGAYWAYLVPGHIAPWYSSVEVGTEVAAIAHSGGDIFATGVGDVTGDHIADFVVNSQNTVWLFAGQTVFTAGRAQSLDGWAFTAFGSADPRVVVAPLGDINGDGLSDFIFNNGATPSLVMGRSSGGWGVSRNLSGYPLAPSGFLAAPGDVNGDGFNDLLLGVPADNSAYLLAGASNLPAVAPSLLVTVTGVAGAASAPYAAGADLNCDQSSDLLLLPAQTPVVTPLLSLPPLFDVTPFVPINRLPVASTPDQSVTLSGLTRQPDRADAAPAIAYVSAAYCASCANDGRTWGVDAFASIQAAIDSGAPSVFISPGIYNEAFHLVNNVTVAGSSAETTIVQAPSGAGAAYLVTADGILSATVRNLSLVGNATTSGLHAGSGTIGLQIARTIIRHAPTAIALDGSTTQVEIVNNTLVKNTNGISATNSAGVDVRNTIFAFNTGTAVSYQSTAPTKLRLYNDYFANGVDLRINGVSQAASGSGEITLDPLYADVNANNYRPLSGSPVIDAGNPSDPTPPGANNRLDLGYFENGQAAFYASANYCATCDNDGLTWQQDAFDTIQAALNAAGNYLKSIGCLDPTQADQPGFCNTHIAVGVGAGTYAENVSVPSHVRLTGVGADSTFIDGSGGTGVAVLFSNVVDAQVSGFTITNDPFGVQASLLVTNTSSAITVIRNLFTGQGGPLILFSQGSSGSVLFNSLPTGGGSPLAGIMAEGANTWVVARNNIIVNALNGLRATTGALIQSDYNYLNNPWNNTVDYDGVISGTHDLVEHNSDYPVFVDWGLSDYSLAPNSLAIDTADPNAPVPANGGANADLGYKELTATPLVLMLGKLGSNACYLGNSGVKQVEVGVVAVANATSSITATAPSTWTTATVQTPGQTASYWTKVITPTTGLARLYSRATDQAGNVEQATFARSTQTFNLYDGALVGDAAAPIVTLTQPLNNAITTTAAMELLGQVSDYVSNTFTVADKFFLVNGTQRIAADWLDTGWTGSGPRIFRAVPILPGGTYTVQAQAVDLAGNVGQSAVNNLTINVPVLAPSAPDTSNHVVSFISPANAAWTNKTTLHVIGAALYTAVAGTDRITLTVNGGAAQPVTITTPSAISTTWTADVSLLISTTNTLSARAFNNLGAGAATNLIVSVDAISPSLTVPASGNVVTQAVTFNGTASDAQSGLVAVDISVDGGYLWLPATLNGANWTRTWQAPTSSQNTSYAVLVRACDRAGNVTHKSFSVIVDNAPPTGFGPIAFNIPIGSYLPATRTLVMTWTLPTDGSGPVTTTGVINQISRTLPVAPQGGNSLSANLNVAGQWFAHLAAVDRAGNRVTADYGPWYVSASLLCASPQRAIVLDGNINAINGEWLRNEFLDDDERPAFDGSPVVRDRQMLYATWDATALYLGWHGAWWTLDGTLFAYVDTATGGTTQPVSATVPAAALPFAADYAVAISGPAQGTFYHFNGSAWQVQAGLTFAQSGLGQTEVRLPIGVSGLSDVRLIAYAVADNNAVWSMFPTTNPLAGPWTDSYHWQPICSVTTPNLNQPRGLSVLTSLSSPQPGGTPYAPSASLLYVVTLDNRESGAVSNVTITLTASTGLTYQSVVSPSGTICTSCTVNGTQWRLTLPSIPTGTTRVLTLTGKLAASLIANPIVTSTLTASAGAIKLSGAAFAHLTDGTPPTVTLVSGVPATLRIGVNTLSGLADDGTGIGVQKVEILPQGSAVWQPVTGTTAWQGAVTVPNVSTFSVQVRATDFYTQVSSIQNYNFTVDNIGPLVTMTLPSAITNTLVQLGGTTSDPYPIGGLVDQVDVQIGHSAAPWVAANGPYTPTAGSQGFNLTWTPPISDGVAIQLRARATDAAGNVITGTWQGTLIDTVAPAISVTLYTPDIVPSLYATPARSGPPVLGGAVTDGGGLSQTWAIVYAPDGTTYTDTVSRTNSTWSYVPYLHNGTGRFVVSIVAVDVAGNLQTSALYSLTPLCTSLVVQNANDSGAGSLRGTLACANPNDTITFAPSLAGQTITLTSSALAVSIPITVDGSSAANVRLSGNTVTRVFSATAPLTLKALTLQNGKATGDGGSLNTTSALTLTNVNVFSSTATGSGGGVAAQGVTSISSGVFQNNGAFAGGGVYVFSTLSVTGTQFFSNTSNTGGGLYAQSTGLLTNTTFISNTTPVWGGAGARIDGPATVSGGVFQTNRAQLEGGGLLTFGTLNLINSQFLTNTANGVGTIGGGGVAAYGAATINGGLFQNNTTLQNGGGLFANATLNLTSTQVISNGAVEGGGLYVANVAALTNASLISNTASSGGGLTNKGVLTMTNSLIAENRTTGGSGGLSNGGAARIVNSRFISNTTTAAGNGGGAIAHNSLSPLVLISTTVQGNKSTGTGGVGGGLYSYSGTVQITGTSFISNQATTSGGALQTYGNTTLANSTLSGNTAGATGGGIHQGTVAAKLSLNNTTIAYNSAGTLNASGVYLAQGVMTTTNSIIANNATSNNLATLGGTFVSLGYNLSNNWNGLTIQPSDKTGDPLLSPLADNGGATWTHALQIGSPAINSADPATALPSDQRGVPRQGVPDIGAYEYSDCPLPPFVVQNANDGGTGSLRIMIACATPNATITFNPSLAGQTITLSSGALIVNAPITVDGSSAANVRLSGNNLTRIFSATAPLTLNALTLQNGATTGAGGALNTTSALTLTNVNVFSSTATGNGGGVAAQGATSISSGVFQNNRCTGAGCGGGGLFVNTTLNLTGTQFISNSAITGGGLYGFGTTALTNVQFISNTSPTYGGGGARIDGPATVTGGLFQANRAQLEGGGLLTFNTLVLSGTQFISNTARGVNAIGGGGLAAYGATTLNGGLFRDNTTLNNGGGLHANAALNLTGTLFINNAANNGGGLSQAGAGTRRVVNSLFARNTATSTLGAALYLTATGSVQILHTTIGSPTVANGAAIFSGAGTVGITDTIIANHTIGISNSLGTVYENHNLFFGNATNKSGSISGGTNDVSGDPRFQNSANDDYHLQSNSAAIDVGVAAGVTLDIDGDLRPIGNGFEIGFDETVGGQFLYLPLVLRN